MVKRESPKSSYDSNPRSMVAYKQSTRESQELPLFHSKGTINPNGPQGHKIRSAASKATMQGPSSNGYGWGAKARNLTQQTNIHSARRCRIGFIFLFCLASLGLVIESVAALVLSFRLIRGGAFSGSENLVFDEFEGISKTFVWAVGGGLYMGFIPGVPLSAYLLTKMSHSIETQGMLYEVSKMGPGMKIFVFLLCLCSIGFGSVLIYYREKMVSLYIFSYSVIVFVLVGLLLAVLVPAGMYIMGYNQEKEDIHDVYLFGPRTPVNSLDEQGSTGASARTKKKNRGRTTAASANRGVDADEALDEEDLRVQVDSRIKDLKEQRMNKQYQVDAE